MILKQSTPLLARWGDLLRRTPSLVFAMAVLSLGLILAGKVVVAGIRTARNTITVTGASTERITSDHVDWTLEVATTGPTQQASFRTLEPAVQRTLAFLKEQNIEEDALEQGVFGFNRQEVRNRDTGVLVSTTWTTKQSILISSPDVDKVRYVSGRIGQLVGEGVPLTINPPAYTFTRLAEKRVDMLAKATRDARTRAMAIAREAGSGIGAITNADSGTFHVTEPNSTQMGNFGSYDTSTIEKDITAVMGVTFRVE